MLIAKRKDGRLFSLLDQHEKADMLALRRREAFYCPVCNASVQMRLGEKRSWHFAHQSKVSCVFEAEAESAYHLKGKKLLYHWLARQHVTVKLEPYLPRLKQRPDLLLHTQPHNTALELQCATIDPALLTKRTETFQRAEIIPIWLLGGNRLNRIGRMAFQIPQMDWLTLRKVSRNGHAVFLLYFCPETGQFSSLTNVIPYSPTKVFAHLIYYPISSFSIHQLFHHSNESNEHLAAENWPAVKKRWRLNAYRYHSCPHRFVQSLYEHLSLFPPAAGMPTSHLHHIETPCFLWQSWLFHQFYLQWPSEKAILLKDVVRAFRELVQQGVFQVRIFPSIKGEDDSWAILAYLRALVTLGFLRENGEKVFQKVNDVSMPQTLDELSRLDAKYFAKLFKVF